LGGKGIPAPPSLSPPPNFVFRFAKCAAKRKDVVFAPPSRAHTTDLLPLFWNDTLFRFGILHYGIYHINKGSANMTKTIYSKDHKFVVEQLKKARLESGLDQEKAAELLGKTQSYISKVESGQRRIDVVQLKEFAKIYKKEVDFFIKK